MLVLKKNIICLYFVYINRYKSDGFWTLVYNFRISFSNPRSCLKISCRLWIKDGLISKALWGFVCGVIWYKFLYFHTQYSWICSLFCSYLPFYQVVWNSWWYLLQISHTHGVILGLTLWGLSVGVSRSSSMQRLSRIIFCSLSSLGRVSLSVLYL